MRICLVYDCLYPYTVGGAERWYRNLAERLAADGHEVSYLTLRQWARDESANVPGVRVIAVGPRLPLYTDSGRRGVLPPLVFGLGVLVHLLARGRRYEVVHTASFPYFSLLAAAVVRPLAGFRIVVDWHEVWTRDYWTEYLGQLGGSIGNGVQALCLRIPQRAFCFSRTHAGRLRAGGLRGGVTVLEGEFAGPLEPLTPESGEALVVFAGRHIPEKQVPAVVPAMVEARKQVPDARCVIFGDGPDRPRVQELVRRMDLEHVVEVRGFVASSEIEAAWREANCMVLPSRREGYGLVVVEAAQAGVPSVVVAGPDNAATELVEEGVNGFVASSDSPEDLGAAIAACLRGGLELRRSTADWYRRNAERLSLASSLGQVAEAYVRPSARR